MAAPFKVIYRSRFAKCMGSRQFNQAELIRVATQFELLVVCRRGHRISTPLSSEWLRDGAFTNACTTQAHERSLCPRSTADWFSG